MSNQIDNNEQFMDRAVGAALRISFVAFLLVMSFWILNPFIAPVVWGLIIAVGVYPLHKKFAKVLKGRAKLSAIIIALIGLSIILIPIVLFASSTIEGVEVAVKEVQDGTFKIERPKADIKDWPLIGETIYSAWSKAADSLVDFYHSFESQIKSIIPKVTGMISSFIGGMLMFVLSILIAAALLVIPDQGKKSADKVFKVLVGERGESFTNLSAATIRSVVQGVLGIALIQSLFISIGLYLIDMPAAGIISIAVLLFAVMQLPPIVIILPVIFYVFSYADTVPAVIFTVWAIFWSAADTFLKPIFLGKGVDVPMLVVLLGAIGGMVVGGPVGLFVGPVVLSLTYKIFTAMVNDDTPVESE